MKDLYNKDPFTTGIYEGSIPGICTGTGEKRKPQTSPAYNSTSNYPLGFRVLGHEPPSKP